MLGSELGPEASARAGPKALGGERVRQRGRSEIIGDARMHCRDAAELRTHGAANAQWRAEGIAPKRGREVSNWLKAIGCERALVQKGLGQPHQRADGAAHKQSELVASRRKARKTEDGYTELG
ncbi:hypothetical protein GGX14DRAFT_406910 [Mycena pura]|uniref:Uncharacterized protein n=1 Tax=Mycena pura TaxID=153505 RepID=A0AAD6UPK9_9AGAR|nr:hypothetical protein GGX14DRAFT_406910 [Mycena pura]